MLELAIKGSKRYYGWLVILLGGVGAGFLVYLWQLDFGLGITGLMNYTGIDYRGIEFAGVTFQSVIYPELAGSQFLVYPFWVLVLTVMVGLYPSVHAARLNPSQAIRRSI